MDKLKIAIIVGVGIVAFLGGIFFRGIDLGWKTKVAVIPIEGMISPGSRGASPSNLHKQINKAKGDGADAFLFQINSPGGTVVASRQMERMIDRIDKPTVCQLQDIGTSGAYWAASACDTVVADPLSITGSIGVSASYLEYSEYMKEEGIEYVRLVKGELKDMGSPYRNVTGKERKLFNRTLENIQNEFVDDIKENRDLNQTQTEKLSSGRTFLGSQAKRVGIVDVLGGRKEAEKILEERLGKGIDFKNYRKEINILDLINLFGKEKKNIESRGDELLYSLGKRSPRLLAI